ncbi:hypothetical protein RRG08_003314 [Elysia crispata]|uniref:Uncharacterized protein n=1 Tax=Elysia crispata TaxID=231223 RepID=A0AAE1DL42_9GAST|nr:hypothetical protein RRG08_003314 [Elysia crispata]
MVLLETKEEWIAPTASLPRLGKRRIRRGRFKVSPWDIPPDYEKVARIRVSTLARKTGGGNSFQIPPEGRGSPCGAKRTSESPTLLWRGCLPIPTIPD